MKKTALLITFCLVLLLSQGMAQTPLQKQLEAIPEGSFSREQLFTKAANTGRVQVLNRYIKTYTLLEADAAALHRIVSHPVNQLELDLPLRNSQVTLQLVRTSIVNANTVLNSPEGKIEYTPGIYYRGVIKDQPNTLVAISFFNNSIMGVIANEDGNYVLGNSNTLDRNSSEYILYNDKDLLEKSSFTCHTPDIPGTGIPLVPLQPESSVPCVDMYFEADYRLYTDLGSNTGSVINFVTALFNVTSALYLNESIYIQLSGIYVWTSTDPYAGAGSVSAALSLFSTEVSGGFPGELAHLLTPRDLGGGEANLDVLCQSPANRVAVSSGLNSSGVVGFPTYSRNVSSVVHEIGHNLGSRHTHACVWNGNNTAIDGCAPTEGGCPRPGNPSNGGTMMSYCHLQSVGINFNLGFGQQPGDLIRSKVAAASCLPEFCPGDITFAHLDYQRALTDSKTWIQSNGQTHISSTANVVLDAHPTYGYVLLPAIDATDYFLADPAGDAYFLAVALNGCEMAPTVDIDGPSSWNKSENHTWTALPSLPASQVRSYSWSYSVDGINFTFISHASSITQLPAEERVYLKLSITAADGQTATATKFVKYTGSVLALDNGYDLSQYIAVSPNPSNGAFVLTVTGSDAKDIYIYDGMGKMVYSKKATRERNIPIHLADLPKGMYLIKVNGFHRQDVRRILTQ